jgi:hypothetical protein
MIEPAKVARSVGQPKKQNKKKQWQCRLEPRQIEWLRSQCESQGKIVRRLIDSEMDTCNG